MAISNELIGTTIARLRKRANMTQQQFAAALGVSHQAVSKWETGAALPDLDTLCDIAHLFGITLDQLISGIIPGFERNTDSPLDGVFNFAQDAFKTVKGIGETIIKSVNDVFDSDSTSCCDEAVQPESSEGEALSLQAIIDLAPFMSREKLNDMLLKCRETPTPDQLVTLAPFISGETMEQLIRRCGSNFTLDNLITLAPFIKKEQLFKLLMTNGGQMTMQTIKTFAPFLKRSMVDTLVDALGGIKKASEAIHDKFDEMAEAVENDIKPDPPEPAPQDEVPLRKPVESATELKTNVARAALEAGSWAWLRAHAAELNDQELLSSIAVAAADMPENRSLVLQLAAKLDAQHIKALLCALCQAHNYGLLSELCDRADSEAANQLLTELVTESSDAPEYPKIVSLCAKKVDNETLVKLAHTAIEDGNWELIELLTPAL